MESPISEEDVDVAGASGSVEAPHSTTAVGAKEFSRSGLTTSNLQCSTDHVLSQVHMYITTLTEGLDISTTWHRSLKKSLEGMMRARVELGRAPTLTEQRLYSEYLLEVSQYLESAVDDMEQYIQAGRKVKTAIHALATASHVSQKSLPEDDKKERKSKQVLQ